MVWDSRESVALRYAFDPPHFPIMFAKAYSMAAKYTVPIITVWRTEDNRCFSSHGAAVLVNADGWIVTAAHIIELARTKQREQQEYKDRIAQKAAIDADSSLEWKEKQRRLKALGTHPKDAAVNQGTLIGQVGLELENLNLLAAADLAVGRLKHPLQPDQEFPIFKNPAQGLQQGTSLCKLGFPLYGVRPDWDVVANSFRLPENTFPMPLFPLDGIYTREITIAPPPGESSSMSISLVETSSPGIPGHSGGPIFDAHGHVWAIQSHTSSYNLGLDIPLKNMKDHTGKQMHAHQFLNVGRGPSTPTILALFNQLGIKCQIS